MPRDYLENPAHQPLILTHHDLKMCLNAWSMNTMDARPKAFAESEMAVENVMLRPV
jgi:hypothetical protein